MARVATLVLLIILALTRAASALPATVTAIWDANTESNLAGYKLSYGTQSGIYTTTIDVGKVTSYAVSLNPGTYYFAVQAYNTNGLISAYSTEVAATIGAPAITSLTPASGAVGTSVVIAGSGFATTPSTVSFNGVPASPTAWSDTSITVKVPSGATTGNVTVTVGGVASAGVIFVVSPTITSTPFGYWDTPSDGAAGLV